MAGAAPGLWGRLLGRKSVQSLSWLPDWFVGPAARSGVSVTWETALQSVAILACCKVIAEDIAQVSCRLMRPLAGGRGFEPAIDHPLFRLLHRKPNDWQTAFEFWETVVLHLVLTANAFVFISRGAGERIAELIILEPGRVTVRRASDLSLSYLVTGTDGAQRVFTSAEIWHLRGLSWNGWMGMDPIKLAREAVGLGIALEEAHARLHANGAQPSGIYTVDGPLADDQQKKLVGWLKANASGDNRGTPLVLDRGAKWLSQQMTGVDAQHLETRRYQTEEVCRALRVMPIMVGLSEKTASYASSEQMFLAHRTFGLGPWGARLSQSAEAALLTEKEAAEGYCVEFALEELVHADFKAQMEGLQIARRTGAINANEMRRRLGMNPRTDKGGDQYIVEANMAVQDGRDLPPPTANPPAPKDS